MQQGTMETNCPTPIDQAFIYRYLLKIEFFFPIKSFTNKNRDKINIEKENTSKF
jgi:hypothetical protein